MSYRPAPLERTTTYTVHSPDPSVHPVRLNTAVGLVNQRPQEEKISSATLPAEYRRYCTQGAVTGGRTKESIEENTVAEETGGIKQAHGGRISGVGPAEPQLLSRQSCCAALEFSFRILFVLNKHKLN